MKIGINALYLLPRKVGGSETYLRNLLKGLAAIDRGNEYVLFINRETEGTMEASVFVIKTASFKIWQNNMVCVNIDLLVKPNPMQ